ncbi:SMP-30/gluconolactonase/LRE family protein [Micromonosporaceae bacterium Da 78-11]
MTSHGNDPNNGQVTVWAAADFELGEGVRWIDGRLIFVDVLTGRLLEVSATTQHTPRELARLHLPLGAVAPLRARPGHWIAAIGTGIAMGLSLRA